ncbi:MAG TPA: polysulfide reductase NrfD [Casimicrobiaceae bacterium]|nr:polysulfide reductase NrfD [Casimicrobiaceae bacterium]
MFEITTTRHNPLIDPQLAVWSWEIPVYLFAGGVVAGMMILGGLAMLRVARGEDPKSFFSLQTPLLAFVLINIGMGALFLDLAHKLYVWRVYLTFQPGSPMSWGSWVLIIVYGVLVASALVRLPAAWPWLGQRLPILQRLSDWLLARTGRLKLLGWANIVLGVGLGIYTGILLNTMVARPLWNSAILGPLFLVSGLSAGAAMMHVASVFLPRRPAPKGMFGGAVSALCQQLGSDPPERRTVDSLIRADIAFLVIEFVLLGLLLINLQTSTASHAAAASLIASGPHAWAFWGVIVVLGILVPLALQGLELSHRIPHTVLPALLVLVGGFALRWVMVNAGQASHIVHAAGL